ncbi:MAG: putative toxin-antitoxin system toxin component, PIN family [Thermomicrobiales bacterium]|nr:putative toxin-antitoxin system toxin component, PIN family [Thermomicrobiales bacterium]
MRAIVDSNVYVSYLLGSENTGKIGEVFGLAAQGRIRLALPPEQIEELQRAITTKRYLRERIRLADLEQFIVLLRSLGDILSPVQGEPPRVLRDRNDDFLIESAKQNEIELIVSGDRDLLEWQDASPNLKVVPPAMLKQYLESRETDQS